MPHALLITLPFASVRRPSLGLGLLKAALQREGWGCDVAYLNLRFAEQIGVENYHNIDNFAVETLLGEWIFSKALWGTLTPDPVQYYIAVLRPAMWEAFQNTDQALGSVVDEAECLAKLLNLQSEAERFVDCCVSMYDWSMYDIVGFTTTFQQNVAALALARRLKEIRPDLFIAFGGANCEGEMGLALHRLFPFVDLVCSGEGDIAFPSYARAHATGGPIPPIPGIICRVDGLTVCPPSMTNPVMDMDTLPVPDFAEFFEQRSGFFDVSPPVERLLWSQPVTVPIESSRGCWWGEKQHCTFCGLNGSTMQYRAKSLERFLSEVEQLIASYGVKELAAVDNIIDMRYFKTVLPQLAKMRLNVKLFYETKANLQQWQVELLRESGISKIQPGIESLNTNILRLMRKGVQAYQNIRLLKWCSEYLVEPHWNILAGFPGEDPLDYADQAETISYLTHLPPPRHVTRVRLDRFSPLFTGGDTIGAIKIRAARSYRYVYPFSDEDLNQLAYYFDFDFADNRDPNSYLREIRFQVAQWKLGDDAGTLLSLDDGESLIIRDGRRRAAVEHHMLTGWQRVVYGACNEGKPFTEISKTLAQAGLTDVSSEAVYQFLDHMIDARLIIFLDGRYLSLCIPGDYYLKAWARHLRAGSDVPADLHQAVQRLFELLKDVFASHLARYIRALSS
jgi:ribosomal peptide maturation radical SAM protein 1